MTRRSPEELSELSRWLRRRSRGLAQRCPRLQGKEQRDVLQSELDAARALLARRARVADPDVHEATGVLNALVVEHGGREECEALAVLLNALRTAGAVY